MTDPSETLQRLLHCAWAVIEHRDDRDREDKPVDHELLAEHAVDLAEYIDALDGWLRKGGHLPSRWRR